MRYSSCVTRRHRRGRTEYVAVLSYYDHSGTRQQKRRTASSYSEAKRLARELEDEYIEGGEVALYSDDLTFEELATHCEQTKYCEAEYDESGNKLSLRNLIYELTSYVSDNEPIGLDLVDSALERLRVRSRCKFVGTLGVKKTDDDNSSAPADNESVDALLESIAREGDIILPLDLCILRREETFKQWTARAKRYSIEAARLSTNGTMQTVAERLGLTTYSLKSHLQRARLIQNETLFD